MNKEKFECMTEEGNLMTITESKEDTVYQEEPGKFKILDSKQLMRIEIENVKNMSNGTVVITLDDNGMRAIYEAIRSIKEE